MLLGIHFSEFSLVRGSPAYQHSRPYIESVFSRHAQPCSDG